MYGDFVQEVVMVLRKTEMLCASPFGLGAAATGADVATPLA